MGSQIGEVHRVLTSERRRKLGSEPLWHGYLRFVGKLKGLTGGRAGGDR